MILTKRYIAVFVLTAIAVAAVTVGVNKYSAREVFSKSDIKIVLDAEHGAHV